MQLFYNFNEGKIDILQALSENAESTAITIGYEGLRGPIKRNNNISILFPALTNLTLINMQLKEDDLTDLLKKIPNLKNLRLEKCTIRKSQGYYQGALNFEGCTLDTLVIEKCKLYLSKLEKKRKINKYIFDLDCEDHYIAQLRSNSGATIVGETTTDDDLFVYTTNTNIASASLTTLKVRLYLLKKFEYETNANEYLSIYSVDAASASSTPPSEQEEFQSANETMSVEEEVRDNSDNDSNVLVPIIKPTITKQPRQKKIKEQSESEYEEESSLLSSTSSSSSESEDYTPRSSRQQKRSKGRSAHKKRQREPTPFSSSSEDSDLEDRNEYYQQRALIAEVVENCRKYRAVVRIKDAKKFKRRYNSPSL